MGVGDETVRRAVFLDRDGVINKALVRNGRPYPPRTAAELEILPGTRDALLRLRESGFLNVVVTNQPDVARGTMPRAFVEKIHAQLRSTLTIDAFYVCWHDDRDKCDCRKPLPGLLLRASADLGIDLERSFMIGDRWRDIAAGQRAGCRTIWIDYGYDEPKPQPPIDFVAPSLPAAVPWLLDASIGLRTLGDH
jgi:D-glycero-D-manno-heptose 1,7-bisphosphate phosphatase